MIHLSARAKIAMLAVRAVNWLSRRARRGAGTVAGGRVGLRICPDLLGQLTKGRTVVAVSGTNGKTSTTALCVAGWGVDAATNATGANMPAGHVAALVERSKGPIVLEVDEAWLADVVDVTHSRVVILLNLSRDQLDRASEVRQLAERWRQCFLHHPDDGLVLVANANDPLVVYAASGARHVRWCDVPTPWLEDARSCPHCTRALEHSASSWHCSCGFAKPVTFTTTLGDELVVGGEREALDLSLPGEFNRANAAMAVTALAELGVDVSAAVVRMNGVRDVAGRFTVRRRGAHTVRLALAKNPAGFAAMLSTIGPAPVDVWIAINARVADGRDPSWLYDVPFEQLRGHRVSCLGDRRLDLATRLDYAGVDCRVIEDLTSVAPAAGAVPLIANYSAFSEWLASSVPC